MLRFSITHPGPLPSPASTCGTHFPAPGSGRALQSLVSGQICPTQVSAAPGARPRGVDAGAPWRAGRRGGAARCAWSEVGIRRRRRQAAGAGMLRAGPPAGGLLRAGEVHTGVRRLAGGLAGRGRGRGLGALEHQGVSGDQPGEKAARSPGAQSPQGTRSVSTPKGSRGREGTAPRGWRRGGAWLLAGSVQGKLLWRFRFHSGWSGGLVKPREGAAEGAAAEETCPGGQHLGEGNALIEKGQLITQALVGWHLGNHGPGPDGKVPGAPPWPSPGGLLRGPGCAAPSTPTPTHVLGDFARGRGGMAAQDWLASSPRLRHQRLGARCLRGVSPEG